MHISSLFFEKSFHLYLPFGFLSRQLIIIKNILVGINHNSGSFGRCSLPFSFTFQSINAQWMSGSSWRRPCRWFWGSSWAPSLWSRWSFTIHHKMTANQVQIPRTGPNISTWARGCWADSPSRRTPCPGWIRQRNNSTSHLHMGYTQQLQLKQTWVRKFAWPASMLKQGWGDSFGFMGWMT